MADGETPSNTPAGGPDYKQWETLREWLTAMGRLTSGQAFAPGVGAAPEGVGGAAPIAGLAGLEGVEDIARAIRELASALRDLKDGGQATQQPAIDPNAAKLLGLKPFTVEGIESSIAPDTFEGIDADKRQAAIDAWRARIAGSRPKPMGPVPKVNFPDTPPSKDEVPSEFEPPPEAPSDAAGLDWTPPPPDLKDSGFFNVPDDHVQSKPPRAFNRDEWEDSFEWRRLALDKINDRMSGGTPYIYDGKTPRNMENATNGTDVGTDMTGTAAIFAYEMRKFTLGVVTILEGLVTDLRNDNTRLSELERYFRQQRETL